MLGKSVILVSKKRAASVVLPALFKLTNISLFFRYILSQRSSSFLTARACARTAKSLILVCDIDLQFSVDLTRANS